MTRSQLFTRGARDSIPMIVGIVPFGIIYGTLASVGGLSLIQALGMSLLVYAGSAQFIALSLLTVGTGGLVILFTALIVNLRHVLYSASLQPFVAHLSGRWRLVLAFGLTDETFALVQRRYLAQGIQENGHWYHAGAALALYLSWVGSSLVGILFGQALPALAGWGLDFAMLATFIGIVVPALRNAPQLAAALAAGAVALTCQGLPYKLGLLAAAAVGIVVGVLLERHKGSETMNVWPLIGAMALVTFLIRYSLFAFPNLRFPPLVRQALHYVPTAVLSAIVVPGMLMPDGHGLQLDVHNTYLLAGLATIVIAGLSRNLLATIGGGMLIFFCLRVFLG